MANQLYRSRQPRRVGTRGTFCSSLMTSLATLGDLSEPLSRVGVVRLPDRLVLLDGDIGATRVLANNPDCPDGERW